MGMRVEVPGVPRDGETSYLVASSSGRSVSPATNRPIGAALARASSPCLCSNSSYDDLSALLRSPYVPTQKTSSPSSSPLRTFIRRCPSPNKIPQEQAVTAPSPYWKKGSFLGQVSGLLVVLMLVGVTAPFLTVDEVASVYGAGPGPQHVEERKLMGTNLAERQSLSLEVDPTKSAPKKHLRGQVALPVVGSDSLGSRIYMGEGIKSEGAQRKYAELASKLKIYVYDLPSKFNSDYIRKDPRVLTHMFAAEIIIHQNLLNSTIITTDPEEADYFFVPVYSTGELNEQGRALPQMSGVRIRQAMNRVVSHWPYFNRSRGIDHVVVVPHDFGACFTFREEEALHKKVPMVLRKMTLLQTFGQHNHTCNRVGRSIVIPPYVKVPLVQAVPGLPESADQPARDKFAYFRGLFHDTGNDPMNNKYSRGVRDAIWRHFKDNALFDVSSMVPSTYYEDMRRSVFCLCPLGWAPWSPRVVESIAQGCIPVVISDQIILPFEGMVDWKSLIVQVAEKDVSKLDKILTSIPAEEVAAMQKRLWKPEVRRALLYPQPMEDGDAFHYALRELARRLEGTRKRKAKVALEDGRRKKRSQDRSRTDS